MIFKKATNLQRGLASRDLRVALLRALPQPGYSFVLWTGYVLSSREGRMVAYCPYCKVEVKVVPCEIVSIARKVPLAAKKRILVKHIGPDGDHVFRTNEVSEK